MVLISVGFISGIGTATDKINYSMNDYYKANNVSDFIIKSKSQYGFSEDEINSVKEIFPGADVDTGMSFDLQTDVEAKRSVRYYFLDFDNWNVNKPEIIEGEKTSGIFEVYAECADNVVKGYNVGDEIDLSDLGVPVKVKVSGIIKSPLTFANDGEPSYNNPEDTEIGFTTTAT